MRLDVNNFKIKQKDNIGRESAFSYLIAAKWTTLFQRSLLFIVGGQKLSENDRMRFETPLFR